MIDIDEGLDDYLLSGKIDKRSEPKKKKTKRRRGVKKPKKDLKSEDDKEILEVLKWLLKKDFSEKKGIIHWMIPRGNIKFDDREVKSALDRIGAKHHTKLEPEHLSVLVSRGSYDHICEARDSIDG